MMFSMLYVVVVLILILFTLGPQTEPFVYQFR